MRQDETGFAEFYRASHQRCLRAVIAGAGRPDLAEDLVAEAFTRALVSWRTVRDHPAPEAWVVRTALNAGTGHCQVSIDCREEELAIEVTDDGRGGVITGTGYGITGMRERTGLLGGQFAAGPRPCGASGSQGAAILS